MFSSVGSSLPVTPFFWRASEIARIPVTVNIRTPIDTISASQFRGGFCVRSIVPSLPECFPPLGSQTSLGFMDSYLPIINRNRTVGIKHQTSPHIEIRKPLPPRADTPHR